jgi:hypothetical protein
MRTTKLLTVQEVPELFVDAVVVDDRSQLLFISIWSQDTTLQAFLARLSLPRYESGLDTLTIQGQDYYQLVEINNVDKLRKHTGRAPKTCLFHGLSQLWLYDGLTVELDRLKRRCVLLCHPSESKEEIFWRLWQAVQELCHVPLLNEWHMLIKQFCALGWIKFFHGKGVNAIHIDLSSAEVEDVISELIRNGHLSLLTLKKEPDFNPAPV